MDKGTKLALIWATALTLSVGMIAGAATMSVVFAPTPTAMSIAKLCASTVETRSSTFCQAAIEAIRSSQSANP